MPNVKGMRWQTAVAVVASGLEAHLAQQSAEIVQTGQLLNLLQRLPPPEPKGRVVGITHLVRGKSKRPQPGSIPDRVLEIVGEFDGPVTMAQILDAKHGAKHYSVTLAVRELVKAGHLVAIGHTAKRRYELPNIKKARPA